MSSLSACGSYLIPISLPKNIAAVVAPVIPTLKVVAGVDDSGLYNDRDLAHAQFAAVTGIANDGSNLYVADYYGTIKKINFAQNTVKVFAGSRSFSMLFGFHGSTDGTGTTAIFRSPYGMLFDSGSLYFADEISASIGKVDATTGNSTLLAGSYTNVNDSTDGTGATAAFRYPIDITSDSANIYTVELFGCVVRQTTKATGNTITIAGDAGPYGFGNCGFANGTGTAAQFLNPHGITIDSSGLALYVADSGNSVIRRVDLSSKAVSTFAGQVGVFTGVNGTQAATTFKALNGLATDGVYLYASDLTAIRKINISTGASTNLAGSTTLSGSSDSTDGTGATARFSALRYLTIMGTDLFASDGAMVRKVSLSTGNTTTVTGQTVFITKQDSTDGTGATARFNGPTTVADDGNFAYVTEVRSNTIRKVDLATGSTTTLAGGGSNALVDSTDGTGATAQFYNPNGIVRVGTDLFVTDTYNYAIRRVNTVTGNTTTFSGLGTPGYVDGSPGVAKFYAPGGLATDGSFLYVADSSNYRVRKVDLLTGTVSTLAGSGSGVGQDGSASTAIFGSITGITRVGNSLYVADPDNFAIRKVDISTGATTTFAGTLGTAGTNNGIGTSAKFSHPVSITTDGTYLFVTDLTEVKLASLAILYSANGSIVRSILISTGEVKTYIGPGGVYDYALSQLPNLNAVFYGSKGLYITSEYGGLLKFQ